MKNISILLIILFAFPLLTFAQWEPVLKSVSSPITALFANDDQLAAIANYATVFRKHNDSLTWVKSKYNFPVDSIGVELGFFYVDKDKIYGSNNSAIYCSTDLGITWERKFEYFGGKRYVVEAIIDSSIYINGIDGSNYLSTNAGKDWEKIAINTSIMDVSFDQSIIIYRDGDSLKFTFDRGATWKKFPTGIPTGAFNFVDVKIINNDLLAADQNSGLYFSIDSGKTWTIEPSITHVFHLKTLASFIIGTSPYGGLYFIEKKNGKYQIAAKALEDRTIFDVIIVNTKLYAATSKGIVFSTDGGKTWNEDNNGFTADRILCIGGTNANELIISTMNSGSLISNDFGETWSEFKTSPNSKLFNFISAYDNLIVYINSLEADKFALYLSTDKGETWTDNRENSELMPLFGKSVLVQSDGSILARTEYGISISFDTLKTWSKVSNEHTISAGPCSAITKTNSTLYAASDNGVLVSTDNGLNWTVSDYVFEKPKLYGIESKDSVIVAFALDSAIYISSNNGISWNTINTNYTSISSAAIVGHYIFINSYRNGIFLTRDFGKNWERVSDGIEEKYLYNVEILDSYIFAGTTVAGVYRAKLSDFGIKGVSDEGRVKEKGLLSLSEPSPNPARAIMRFEIYWSGIGELDLQNISIFNIYGKVADGASITLERRTPNHASLVWDCSNFEPGIYFIVVRHEAAVQMIKAAIE